MKANYKPIDLFSIVSARIHLLLFPGVISPELAVTAPFRRRHASEDSAQALFGTYPASLTTPLYGCMRPTKPFDGDAIV